MGELDLDARLDAVTIAEPARPYYGRMTIDEVLGDALTRIEEWDYESDAHGYCHERSDWLALVAEVRWLRAQVERLETLATEIERGEWSAQWRENNVHGAIRSRLDEHTRTGRRD